MKINQNSQVKQNEKNQQYKSVEQNKTTQKKQEQVSNNKEEIKSNTSQIIKTSSTINTAKVDEIKQKIANGDYKVDAKSISDKLLQDKNLMKTLLK